MQEPVGSACLGLGGDVEIWVNAQRPWDPEDSTTTIKETHLQITSVGPRFFVLSIAAPWIRLDVLTAHAPHTWDQEAIAKGDVFLETRQTVQIVRRQPQTVCSRMEMRRQYRVRYRYRRG